MGGFNAGFGSRSYLTNGSAPSSPSTSMFGPMSGSGSTPTSSGSTLGPQQSNPYDTIAQNYGSNPTNFYNNLDTPTQTSPATRTFSQMFQAAQAANPSAWTTPTASTSPIYGNLPSPSLPAPAPPGTPNFGTIGGVLNQINSGQVPYTGASTMPSAPGGSRTDTAQTQAPAGYTYGQRYMEPAPTLGGYAPPQGYTTPQGANVQTAVQGMSGTYGKPSLDNFLGQDLAAYTNNPSSIENGTAPTDISSILRGEANQYLNAYPGTGNQSDIDALVNKYQQQYGNYINQYRGYLGNNAQNIGSLSSGNFVGGGTPNYGAASNGVAAANAAPQSAANSAFNQRPQGVASTQANGVWGPQGPPNWLGVLANALGVSNQPSWSQAKTPLGYTQYQQQVPQSMNQMLLQQLFGGLGGLFGQSGQSSGGANLNSFWNLLGGGGGNNQGTIYNNDVPSFTNLANYHPSTLNNAGTSTPVGYDSQGNPMYS